MYQALFFSPRAKEAKKQKIKKITPDLRLILDSYHCFTLWFRRDLLLIIIFFKVRCPRQYCKKEKTLILYLRSMKLSAIGIDIEKRLRDVEERYVLFSSLKNPYSIAQETAIKNPKVTRIKIFYLQHILPFLFTVCKKTKFSNFLSGDIRKGNYKEKNRSIANVNLVYQKNFLAVPIQYFTRRNAH